MATEQELRDGAKTYLKDTWQEGDLRAESIAGGILEYLDKNDVVRKVDRELPISITYSKKAPVTIEQTLISPNIKRMIKALGLAAVEPLIE